VPEAWVTTTPDQLLGLGEELDLANAAPADFHVVAGEGDGAAAAMRVDLPLDRMDVLDRREVEMLTPDIRHELAQERGTGLLVAGDRTRLDHRGAFPVLAQTLVIELGGLGRDRERCCGGVGTKAEIGAQHVAVGSAIVEDPHQAVDQPDEGLLERIVLVGVDDVAVVQRDEIDVAGVVELARPELAHADDDEARAATGIVLVGEPECAARRSVTQKGGYGGVDREVGEVAERVRDPFQRPQIGDVGQRGRQRGPALHRAQQRHQAARRRLRIDAETAQGLEQIGNGLVGPPGQQAPCKRKIVQQDVAQIGAVAEQRGKETRAGRIIRQGARELREFVAGLRGDFAQALALARDPVRVGGTWPVGSGEGGVQQGHQGRRVGSVCSYNSGVAQGQGFPRGLRRKHAAG
jgi:hypothetical protein